MNPNGNGIRIKWSTVGALAGALVTILVLFGTGLTTWGGDRGLLLRNTQDIIDLREALRKHLETVEPLTHRFVAVEQSVKDLTAKVSDSERRQEDRTAEILAQLTDIQKRLRGIR